MGVVGVHGGNHLCSLQVLVSLEEDVLVQDEGVDAAPIAVGRKGSEGDVRSSQALQQSRQVGHTRPAVVASGLIIDNKYYLSLFYGMHVYIYSLITFKQEKRNSYSRRVVV